MKMCGIQPCWLGLTEKPSTGDRETPPDEQEWVWADGTTPKTNKYNQWLDYGKPYGEPNNGRTSYYAYRVDERNAVLESGSWYDKKSSFKARAACEATPDDAAPRVVDRASQPGNQATN